MSFLNVLLAADPSAQHLLDDDAADLAAGREWGLYRRGVLLATFPAFYIADLERQDAADANDEPVGVYSVREMESAEVAA